MHLMPRYGNTYKEILKDKIKKYIKIKLPLKGDKITHISEATGYGVKKFTEVLKNISPNFVIILGDRFEALSLQSQLYFLKYLSSTYMEVKVPTHQLMIHTSSITKMANFHFVSNKFYSKRLISMGEDPKNVHITGSLALDNMTK